LFSSVILFFILNPLSSAGLWKQPEEIPQTEFEKFLQDGDISKVVVVNKHQARIYLFPEAMDKPDHKKVRAESPLFKTGEDSDVPQYRMEIGVLENFENRFNKIVAENNLSNTQLVYRTEQNFVGDLLITVVLPLVLFVGLWIFLMRRAGGGFGGGQFFNIGRSRAKLFDGEKDKKITFQDVAGLEGAKEEVQEIVDFLKNPEKYTSLGGKIPKGALLVGPPGTGKTLLAKAVAGEAQVPFFSLSGSDFVEMFVGVGASRVRDLFRQAKEKSPSIIFIDEIDKVAVGSGSSNRQDPSKEGVQRDLLPIVEGSNVNTKFGNLKTDHILFIAAGAFHISKPSDLIPELQGRFPLRVELDSLDEDALYQILTQPKNSLLKQYIALLSTENVELEFDDEAIKEIARIAHAANEKMEDIGARRLHTVIERVIEDISFEASEKSGEKINVTKELVKERLKDVVEDQDLARYIL